MKNKKTLAILLIVLIGLVGLTIAYFSNTTSIDNLFETKPYGSKVEEQFESPDNWLPGTTTPKTLTVTNTGEVDEAVRISYTEIWTSKNAKNNDEEGDLELQQGDNKAAVINFINPDDWTRVVENDKVYYYYNYKLSPNETTSELLDSVTFNAAITNDYNCVESETDTSKTMKCKSTGNGYDGATYKLTFNIETVQYNKYKNAWGTVVEIAEARPEPEPETGVNGVEYLMENALNESSATYNDQTKSKMFVFNHPATVQTPALTDYRYIGDAPYNYVKFNCDNDGTNCEIWRIIGVFDVDDGSGNYEQRIKLVRGSEFLTTMDINPNYNTDWTIAPLKTFLNEDYFNRTGDAETYGLKKLTQEFVDDSVYYLGALVYNGYNSTYGTAEVIYKKERGNVKCDSCGNATKLIWTGKIGLMYPSDEYMVYGNGVNEICYSNSTSCNETNALTGWIFSSNIREGQTSKVNTWLLSTYSGAAWGVMTVDSTGYLSYDYSPVKTNGVRPVVYLKSSIKILSGTGEESNPYVLSN